MLNSAIKNHGIKLYKKSSFYMMKIFEKGKVFYFCLRSFWNFTKFSFKIFQKLLLATLKFILNLFLFKYYHKSQAHKSHHASSKMFHKNFIILTFHVCIWNLSLVWFWKIYLTKFESTFKFLHTKFLGKEFQGKLYFNDIVSIKPRFLANWEISKTQLKPKAIHGLGIAR